MPPPATPEQASDALRQDLLGCGWPTLVQVGRANSSQAANKARWAKGKRDAGEPLGVWSVSERTYRHPTFQLTADAFCCQRSRSYRPRRKREKVPLAERQQLDRPATANEVWSMNFVFDRTVEGRVLKCLTVVAMLTPKSQWSLRAITRRIRRLLGGGEAAESFRAHHLQYLAGSKI